MSKKPVEIVAIIDRSGSMSTIKNEAIGGFNAFLASQREIDEPALMSLVLFDNICETPYTGVDLKHVKDLDDETYRPRGMTALFDAVGTAVSGLLERNPKRAVICILTDGAENSSSEFSGEGVKKLITEAEDKGWQVVFLGANIDVKTVSANLGIIKGVSASFSADSHGVNNAYATMTTTTRAYREQL